MALVKSGCKISWSSLPCAEGFDVLKKLIVSFPARDNVQWLPCSCVFLARPAKAQETVKILIVQESVPLRGGLMIVAMTVCVGFNL